MPPDAPVGLCPSNWKPTKFTLNASMMLQITVRRIQREDIPDLIHPRDVSLQRFGENQGSSSFHKTKEKEGSPLGSDLLAHKHKNVHQVSKSSEALLEVGPESSQTKTIKNKKKTRSSNSFSSDKNVSNVQQNKKQGENTCDLLVCKRFMHVSKGVYTVIKELRQVSTVGRW